MELRPEVEEVVAQLGEAAASWDGIMPPCSRDENIASGPEEVPDSSEYSEFEFLVLCWYYSPNNGTGRIFRPLSGGVGGKF